MTKRALLIGCNYSAIPSVKLQGCINDIINVRNMLVDAYDYPIENIIVLRDDNPASVATMPTRSNILAALKTVVGKSAVGDELWVHYSGHGTQVNDTSANPDEPQDEAIVPCDFQKAGFIVDDELFDIFKTCVATTVIAFDSCHSGTAVDLEFITNCNKGSLTTATTNPNKHIANPNIFMFSGCRDNQTSADAYSNFEKEPVGAFTDALLETLRANRHSGSIIKIYTDLCASLSKNGFSQIPCLSSSSNNSKYTFQRNAPMVSVANPVVVQTPPSVATATPKYPTGPAIKRNADGSVFYRVEGNGSSVLSNMPLRFTKK